MSFIPETDFTILETATLTPIYYNAFRVLYQYDFGYVCLGTTATTSVSICNLTSNPIVIDSYYNDFPSEFPLEDLSGLTIGAYGVYTYDWSYTPSILGESNAEVELGSGDTSNFVSIVGTGVDTLIEFVNDSCFIDYGTVGVDSYITSTKEFINVTDTDLILTFSGVSQYYTFNNPIILTPGSNLINFTFNPQIIGNCNETLILQGNCSDHILNFCGNSIVGNSVNLDIDNNSSYVNCCSYPTLTIYNNHFGLPDNTITATSITYPTELITELTLPIEIAGGSCTIIDFSFCPIVTGFTSDIINVEYIYDYYGTILTGYSEIDIVLSAFTHPFTTLNINCISFNCNNVNTEAIFNLTNSGNEPFQFYYLFTSDNGYDFYNIFHTNPEPPCIVPPFSTTGITINLDVSYLTTASTFSDIFHLKLVDPICCKEFTKCVTVNFCPTTVSPVFGYPVNVNCYGGNDGQHSVTINDCSGGYSVYWSSTTISHMFDDQLYITGLTADNYTAVIINMCSATTYYDFTITQPDPLFVSITYTNPANYCKSDISGLCGIVPSPDINPAGYVVIDKETLVKVVNNDLHDIPGQTKRGYQQYDMGENSIAAGQQVDSINSFRNYILNFMSGTFANYKNKLKKEEKVTVKLWDEMVADTIGQGCCFASYVSGGTTPYTYQWFGPNGYTSTSPNIFDIPCCDPYTLVITDAHGCVVSATSTCLQCTFGIETLSSINPTCTNSIDGEIFVAVSGNCPDAIYQIQLESTNWIESHTASTYNFINLSKGNYTLYVENLETECKLDPINITLQPKYEFYIGANMTGSTCVASCDGIVDIWVNVVYNEDNVDPVFLYTLDGHGNYSNSPIFTGICSGNHTISVMNTLNYCEITETITVPNLNYPIITVRSTPASSKFSTDGTITITVEHAVSFCTDRECYILENTDYTIEIQNELLYDEDINCWITSENDDCVIDVEINHQFCSAYTTFNGNSYTMRHLLPGTYHFCLTDARGCTKCFRVIVGYDSFKKRPDKVQFDSTRTDSYSGSKITSNVPRGQ